MIKAPLLGLYMGPSYLLHLLINIPLKSPGSNVTDFSLSEEKHLVIILFINVKEVTIITNP